MSSKQTAVEPKETSVKERRRNWRLQRVRTHHPGDFRSTTDASSISHQSGHRDSWWRTTISQFSRQKSSQHPNECSTLTGIRMQTNHSRRQSFLYRSGTQLDAIGNISGKLDGQINREREDQQFITPFAQILSILKNAHSLLVQFKNEYREEPSDKTPVGGSFEINHHDEFVPPIPNPQTLEDIIRDFDWCLDVLESIQCKRSVSSLTRAKFCSMLNRELSTSLSDNATGPKGLEDKSLTGQTIDDETGEVGSNGTTTDAADINQTFDGKTNGATAVKQVGKTRAYLSRSRGLRNQQTHSTCSSQISDYIYQTFVEDDDNDQLFLHPIDKHDLDRVTNDDSASLRLNGLTTDTIEIGKLEEQKPLHQSTLVNDESRTKNPELICQDLIVFWKEPATFNVEDLLQFIEENDDCIYPDFFQLDNLTNHHCLSTYGLHLLWQRRILQKLSIPLSQMWICMQRIEELYTADTPFHNAIHAVDVLHTMHTLFTFNQLDTLFSDLEVFATLFACIIHDVDHPGVTNQYLINTNSELAILYNDSSVLENHHLFVAFNLLHAEPSCDFTAHFSRAQRQIFRKMVISLVLSTDMSKHMSLLADLKTMVESQHASGSSVINLDTYSSRIQILESLVHAADLGNPTKPLPIYQEWVSRITEEMFRQGDKEREEGLEISPMCDRYTACVNTTQVTFIDFIVYPLWEALSELFNPDVKPLLENMIKNREWYAQSPCGK